MCAAVVQCKDKVLKKAHWAACLELCRDKYIGVRAMMLHGLRSMARSAEPFLMMTDIRPHIAAMLADDAAAVREMALQAMIEGMITPLAVQVKVQTERSSSGCRAGTLT